MNYWLLALLCASLSLDVLRSAFFFTDAGYPAGYRLKEVMWRTLAVAAGGGLGLLAGMISPGNPLKLDFALLMLVGIKMVWQGVTTLPHDADSRFPASMALLAASSINLFLAGLALGIMGKALLFAPLFTAISTLVFQTISHRFATGPLRENTSFRPVVMGGVFVLIICILHYIT